MAKRPMFEDAKETLAWYVLPKSRRERRPLPSWPVLLFYGLGHTLLMSLWRALVLTVLVWVIGRYWWHAMPSLGYLPAVAICFLIELGRRNQETPPPPATDASHDAAGS